MSKGRRLVTAVGIALAVAFGVRLGVAQVPPARTQPATKTAPKKKKADDSPAPGDVVPAPGDVVPATPVPDPADPPLPVPADDPLPATDPPLPVEEVVPAPGEEKDDRTARLPRANPANPRRTTAPGTGNRAPAEVAPGDDATPLPTPGLGVRTRDEMVLPAQAPTPEAGAAPGTATDAGGAGFFLKPEDLPTGLHSVGLTVNVLAPAHVNLNVKTTLEIVLKNSGTTDAQGVVVRETLPDGLEFIDSQPSPSAKQLPDLVWNFRTLPANAEKRIKLYVKATKRVGPIDHAPVISLLTGGRARMAVHEPKLKVEVRPSASKVEKGRQVRFDISVTNTGDGPARDVVVVAKLGPGLRHEEGGTIELPLRSIKKPLLGVGETVDVDFVADSVAGGEQQCEVTATSPDVAPGAPEARAAKVVDVVESRLVLKLKAPPKRYTGNLTWFHLTLENPGTAIAKNVRAVAVLPASGGSLRDHANAQWTPENHRLLWEVGDIEPGKTVDLPFSVVLNGVQVYRVDAAAAASGIPKMSDSGSTHVLGMSDLRFSLVEQQRAIDVNQDTVFKITLRNDGSADARNVLVNAALSEHLEAQNTSGTDEQAKAIDKRQVKFPQIARLAPGASMVLTIQALAVKPGSATCTVEIMHDDSEGSRLQKTEILRVTDSAANP